MDDEAKQLLREIRDLLIRQDKRTEVDIEAIQKHQADQAQRQKDLMHGTMWRFYLASFLVFFVIGTATVVCSAMLLKVLAH